MKLDKSSHIYGQIRSNMGWRFVLSTLLLFGIGTLHAQEYSSPDFMRSIGKIYVVAGVCLIILLTLLTYMVILDRKITRLEKRQKK
jgi:vacuolar-type H+-ATPase subunit I/STV1